MNEIKWKGIVEVVGAISIIASLIYVGIEVRQTQDSIENERTIARIQLGNDLRFEINDHLEVWIKGNSGATLSELESELYKNLILSRWAQVTAIGVTAIALDNDIANNPGIISFSTFLHSNPGARSTWEKHITNEAKDRELITGRNLSDARIVSTVIDHLEILDSRRKAE